jgi:glutamyl-tRNA(Gln) amidotransferase subunit E
MEGDALLIAAGPVERLRKGFASIEERARMALRGTVSEVRAVNDDATSRYLRPMPGAARMYPETDLPPVDVTSAALDGVRAGLPPLPEDRAKEVEERTGVSAALVDQLSQTDLLDAFEEVSYDERSWPGADAQEAASVNSAVARLLLTGVQDAMRVGKGDWKALQPAVEEVRNLLRSSTIAREAAEPLFRRVVLEGTPLKQALAELAAPTDSEARAIVRGLVASKADLVRERGAGAQGPLMGLAMKELRGKVDGKTVAEWLRLEIEALLAQK